MKPQAAASEPAPLDPPTMHSALGGLMRREPVVAPLDAPVRAALETMARENVDAMVVADPATGFPLGIFTLHDLLRRVALAGGDLDEPVLAVMTAGLVTLKTSATAHQAATAMARHGIGHIVVTDEQGRLAGLVSRAQLFELKRPGAPELQREIARSPDLPALVQCAEDTRRLARHLLAQGLGAEPLNQLLSTLNDLITSRVIELTIDEIELPDVAWCWLAFGSEGRLEQTLTTDQDNGIVFEAATPAEAAALRAAFLPFAQAVNRRLGDCGFALCKGNIMAGNPACCLSLAEWRGEFAAWIGTPRPAALLKASIFFDLRPLYGRAALAERLQAWLLEAVAGKPLFLRILAEGALQQSPPLGLFGSFSYRSPKQHPHTLDLKTQGARLFVDAARVLALAQGVAETNTVQRLHEAARAGRLGADEARAMADAFFFIQGLRLRHQQGVSAAGAHNRIDPAQLNELDRLILREAFKQARRLQQRLQLDYCR